MENNTKAYSIFGKWWMPIRKWFYPFWLFYELSIRFYGYTISVNDYFIDEQVFYASTYSEMGLQILALISSLSTYIICTAFLTVPACLVLHYFFKIENLTGTNFEIKAKRYF